MTRRLITTGSSFEALAGYSRAVVQGDWCFVAGTTGYDYATMTIPESVGDQTRNAVATIERTLVEAGFALTDVVRATYYLTDASSWPQVAPVLGELMADIRPAATALVTGLIAQEMKIEIEVTALLGGTIDTDATRQARAEKRRAFIGSIKPTPEAEDYDWFAPMPANELAEFYDRPILPDIDAPPDEQG